MVQAMISSSRLAPHSAERLTREDRLSRAIIFVAMRALRREFPFSREAFFSVSALAKVAPGPGLEPG